jgi:DNA-binding NarL/FixJ family response regulator
MIQVHSGESKIDLKIFTPRERMILNLVAEGYKNKEIAEKLYISQKAVRENQVRLMRKLNAPKISLIIVYALANGLVNMYDVLESRFSRRKLETN